MLIKLKQKLQRLKILWQFYALFTFAKNTSLRKMILLDFMFSLMISNFSKSDLNKISIHFLFRDISIKVVHVSNSLNFDTLFTAIFSFENGINNK